ncbi:hypothetical protein OSB04_028323 [Centaurea solstitialis]|uniref:FBD domain-containing protein n=1 Tax=Centaurea solstitialis TaxID=347529 RepID=A0AA38W0I4_9ASTR|nr:hypothetical protein OSB04_028323 [Centaurea solstitialis]
MFFQICWNIPYLQVLELRFYISQQDSQVYTFPKLLKLKQLIVEVNEDNLSLLTSMVEACPNLKRFRVKKSSKSRLINRQAAKQSHQLEVVEIDGYLGRIRDLEFVMYFIENSVALKKLVIIPCLSKVELECATSFITNEKTKENKKAAIGDALQQIPVGVELLQRSSNVYAVDYQNQSSISNTPGKNRKTPMNKRTASKKSEAGLRRRPEVMLTN